CSFSRSVRFSRGRLAAGPGGRGRGARALRWIARRHKIDPLGREFLGLARRVLDLDGDGAVRAAVVLDDAHHERTGFALFTGQLLEPGRGGGGPKNHETKHGEAERVTNIALIHIRLYR